MPRPSVSPASRIVASQARPLRAASPPTLDIVPSAPDLPTGTDACACVSLLCVTIDALAASSSIRDAGGAAFACLPSVAAGARARVEALASERDALARERDESRAILGALAAAASDARTSLDTARGDVAARAAETAALRAEIAALHVEAATLRERLESAAESVAAAARAAADSAQLQVVKTIDSKERVVGADVATPTPPGGAPHPTSVSTTTSARTPRASPPRKSLLAAEAAAASSAAHATAAGRDAADARTDAAYWRARAERAEALADQLSGVVAAQADALCDAAYAGEQRLRESDADWLRCGGGGVAGGDDNGCENGGVAGEARSGEDSGSDPFGEFGGDEGGTLDAPPRGLARDGTTIAQRAVLLAHAFGARESAGVLRASRLSVNVLSAARATRAKSPPPPAPRLVSPPPQGSSSV